MQAPSSISGLNLSGLNLLALAHQSAAGAPTWVHDLKRDEAVRFQETGFPSLHDEDWKYTDVSPIRSVPIKPVLQDPPNAALHLVAARLQELGIAAPRVVFVNGRFVPTLSDTDGLPDRVRLSPFSEPSGQSWVFAERNFGRLSSGDPSPFAALNTGLFVDGAVLYFGNGAAVEEPVHVVFASIETPGPAAAYPRLLILMGHAAEGTVAETYLSLGRASTFANAVTEVHLQEGAILSHCRFVAAGEAGLHVGATEALLNADSSYRSLQLQNGGRLVRADLNVTFGGEAAECVLNGAYVGSGTQHLDNHTRIDHAVPHCTSRQLYKGMVADSATAVFNGKIVVRPGAQKTDAVQTNKNLLLSTRATVDAKPQLEILADDVRCTHGAASGPPNDDALFYLRSRGLDAEEAIGLLAYGFAADVVRAGATGSLRLLADTLLKDAVSAAVKSAIPV